MLPAFMNRPFTRLRYPTTMDHGAEVPNLDADPVALTVYGSLQPGTGTVDKVNRNGAEVVRTIFAQPGSDVAHLDLFDIGGHKFFVNGDPDRWETGILDHMVIHLSRWIG